MRRLQSVLRMIDLLCGMMHIPVTKEQLVERNAMLNKISSGVKQYSTTSPFAASRHKNRHVQKRGGFLCPVLVTWVQVSGESRRRDDLANRIMVLLPTPLRNAVPEWEIMKDSIL